MTIKVSTDVIFMESEDGIMVNLLSSDEIFKINALSAQIFKLIDSGLQKEDIIPILEKVYTGDGSVEELFDKLIKDLKDKNIIIL